MLQERRDSGFSEGVIPVFLCVPVCPPRSVFSKTQAHRDKELDIKTVVRSAHPPKQPSDSESVRLPRNIAKSSGLHARQQFLR